MSTIVASLPWLGPYWMRTTRPICAKRWYSWPAGTFSVAPTILGARVGAWGASVRAFEWLLVRVARISHNVAVLCCTVVHKTRLAVRARVAKIREFPRNA